MFLRSLEMTVPNGQSLFFWGGSPANWEVDLRGPKPGILLNI